MRVAVDASSLFANWGGIPKYLVRIVEGLVEAGDRVELLANADRLPRSIAGAELVPLTAPRLALWREAVLPAWLARARPDVFWSPSTRLPRLVPVPGVVTVHDLAPQIFANSKTVAEARLYERILPRSARRARRVIAVSETTARDAERLWQIDPARVRVVPLGVDPSFHPGDRAAAQDAVASRFGLRAPWLLAVGSLEPRKGLDVLIEAARIAGATGRPWRVALAGRPAFDGERIEEAARAAGCVLLGGIDEDHLLELYRAADLLAAPSVYEGFGLTPLEAMACGTPVVIAGGSGGLVETSGPAATVVEQRTGEAWVEAIDDALARREAHVAPSIAHAARFRWADAVQATRAVFAEAAG